LALFAAADLDDFRGLPRLAEFPLRSFARFGFAAFLRLAIDAPWLVLPRRIMSDQGANRQRGNRSAATYQQIAA
jgi:hypothetical protein